MQMATLQRQAVQQCILGPKDILCIVQNSLSLLGVGLSSVVAVMNLTDHVTFFVFGLLHWRTVNDLGMLRLRDT